MKTYLAIDVGGSAIKYGIVTEGTRIPYESIAPTPRDTMEHLLETYREIYRDAKEHNQDEDFDGVAISFTASMDGRTGYCYGGSLEAYTRDKNLLDIFRTAFPVPVAVENDGNCAALAEGRYGSLKGLESGIMLVLGTGLGGGLLKDGKIHYGKGSCSGEFSYILVDPRSVYEGRPEIWALHNGSHALTARLAQAKGEDIRDGKYFFEKANAGDADALRILKEFTDYLAVWIFNLQCVYAPDKVAIGGGISRQPLLMQYLEDSRRGLYDKYPSGLPEAEIVLAEFTSEANLIGAVCHFEDFYA